MKKIAVILLILIGIPAFAITDSEQMKYQQKIEKIRQKQALKCAKNPAKCTTPIQQQNLTLGIVQKEIKIGMSQADVALALGSPNIVTKDETGKDTWIYDKMSSVTAYNDSGFNIGAGGFGGGGGIGRSGIGGGGGMLNAGFSSSKGGSSSNNKTLTVVIKFDKSSKVESFNYHMSNF